MSINRDDTSFSTSTQMESLIPPSKISTLTQGIFVGAVADNNEERIPQKIFHCEMDIDTKKVGIEMSRYHPIPQIRDFTDDEGTDRMKETIEENYYRIKNEVVRIVDDELERINNDPALRHLIP